MRYEPAWSSDGLHNCSYAWYVHCRRPAQRGTEDVVLLPCSSTRETRLRRASLVFCVSFVQSNMSELDAIFSSIQNGTPPNMPKKRKSEPGDNMSTKSTSSKPKKKSKSHTTTSSDASQAIAPEKASAVSKSKASTPHIPSASNAAVPVVVHDDTSSKSQSKSAQKRPPPKDDADAAFADSRGMDRTCHERLTQANALRKDTVCLQKRNSS